MASSPGQFTFLFTDIEGSAHLWEQYPEAMARQLARHDAILQQAIESHGGGVLSRGGDGFCAAFASSEEALLAAMDILLPDDEWRWTGRAELWMFVSWAALDAGRYDDVPHYTQKCLDEARRYRLSVIEAHALATAARAALAVDDLTAANDLATEAVSVAARIFGSNYAVSDARLVAADVSFRLGLVSEAVDHVRHARTAAQRYGIPTHGALADIEEAKITAELGSIEEARRLIDRARRVVTHTDDPLLRLLEIAQLSLDAAATTRSTQQ